MKQKILIHLFILSVLVLTSCTSYWVRKECEKLNWYQHGFDIAMKGKRLTGDAEIKKCQDADFNVPDQQLDLGFKSGMSNYCKPETVYGLGKNGDFLNLDMCDGNQTRFLSQKHHEGVLLYCAVENGYSAGASGKKYQNICPQDQEKNFLKEYNRGRKTYLTTLIADRQHQNSELDNRIHSLESERIQLSSQLSMLPGPQVIRETIYNPISGQYDVKERNEDPYSFQRSNLQNQIYSINQQINDQRTKQDANRSEISEAQRELNTLG